MKVILVCAAGMSSSLLVVRILEAAKKRGINLDIDSTTTAELDLRRINQYDAIMLGPQVRYYKKRIEESGNPRHIPIITIDFQTYGLAKGDDCLDLLLNNLNK
jgi:cellobiose PTS system EIIB component